MPNLVEVPVRHVRKRYKIIL